jgi:ABC-type uncharacterized transport system auxiliary subunit
MEIRTIIKTVQVRAYEPQGDLNSFPADEYSITQQIFENHCLLCYTSRENSEAIIKNIKFILFLLLSIVWGCAGQRFYDLSLQPVPRAQSIKIDKILMVDDIWSNEALWHQSLIIRRSSYTLRYLPFKQWAERPEEMIKNAVIRFFRSSDFFTKVIADNSSMEPDILMQIHVDALEMLYEDNQWHAHLALDIEVIDSRTEKPVLSHVFDRKMRIKGNKAKYVPEKISLILKKELLTLVERLKQAMTRQPSALPELMKK